MSCDNLPDPTGKYVVSCIDGETYCRKNGSFKRHLVDNGYDYESYYNAFYGSPKQCEYCGKETMFVSSSMSYRSVCGDVTCRNQAISQSKKDRSPEQWSKQRDAFRETMSTKSVEDLRNIILKRVETFKNNFGLEHPKYQQLDPDSHKKLIDKEWMLDQHHRLKKTAVQIAEELNCGITTATNWLHRHGIEIKYYRCSQVERNIIDFLQTNYPDVEIQQSNRSVISPLELDLYIPKIKLGIEVNGVYWHGETKGKDSQYHLQKTQQCNESNVRLLHIFDSEWINKERIIKSRLGNMLGKSTKIYARKCRILQLNSKQANEFLKDNHIQGASVSPYAYGLMYDNELVAVMTFAKSRYNKNVDYELIRYCNKVGYSVVGGSSRLLSYFKTEMDPTSIITYSDRRWNTGNMYQQIGFTYSHTSSPNFFYFRTNNPYELFSRQKFQKHKLKDILDNYDPQLSEWQNMLNNGYDRIWDCGNDVWIWKK